MDRRGEALPIACWRGPVGDFRYVDSGWYVTNSKLVGENLALAQRLLEEGKNNCEVARQCNVTESSVRYAIKVNHLKNNVKLFRS